MKYSIIQFKTISNNNSFRLDSEYYDPVAISYEDKLSKLKAGTLKELGYNVVSGPFGSSLKSEVYTNSGIPFIRISDLDDFFISKTNLVYIPPADHDRLKSSQLKEGDLVLSKVGNTIGVVSIVDNSLNDVNISENNIGIRLWKLKDLKDKYVILTYLNSYPGQLQILRRLSGNAQPKLNVSDVEDIIIPNFSSMFKDKIAMLVGHSQYLSNNSTTYYDSAEGKLMNALKVTQEDLNKTHLTFSKNYSKVLFAERFDAEYYQPKYESIVDSIKNVKHKPLGDLVNIKKSIEVGSSAYTNNGVPYVRVSNLSKYGITQNNQQYVDSSLHKELSKHQPLKGEILLSKDATPGIAYLLSDTPQSMLLSSGILRLSLINKTVLPEYLTLTLNSPLVQKQIERDAGGSIIIHWLIDQIKSTLIPIADLKTQEDICNLVRESFKLSDHAAKLLDIAKRSVEISIDRDEHTAMTYIEDQLSSSSILIP